MRSSGDSGIAEQSAGVIGAVGAAAAARAATCHRVGGNRPVRPSARARAAVGGAGRATVRGLVFLIQLYRHMVSPLRPATCRFVPTCSQYAVDALTEYGFIRGSWLAAVRLAK